MLERLNKIIRNYTGDNNITITENTVLISDLGLNSFDIINLVCEMEDEFNIAIPDRAIKELKTVGDVMAFIEKQ